MYRISYRNMFSCCWSRCLWLDYIMVIIAFNLILKWTNKVNDIWCFRISILSSAFFWTFAVPGIGTKWLYYILPISTGLTIPLALLVKDEYRRTTIDAESRTPEGLSRAESIQDFGHLRITTTWQAIYIYIFLTWTKMFSLNTKYFQHIPTFM